MAEDGTGSSAPETGQQDAGQQENTDGLKSALVKTREENKALKARASEADALKAELAKFQEASKSETEKLIEQARREGADGVRSELTAARVLDKIEVRAAGKFADPEDAQLRLAGKAAEFVGKDGTIDTEAIDKALTELLEAKPHLAAAGKNGFRGSADQGTRKDSATSTGFGTTRLMDAYGSP